MKLIELTRGYFTKVDDEDYDRIVKYKWHLGRNDGKQYYASRCGLRRNNIYIENFKTILMHRQIMNAKSGQFIDHIDGDGLNNQKSNLRFCTLKQNRANARKHANATSIFKGVRWNANRNKWYACIGITDHNGKEIRKHLGVFLEEKDAAMAYDAAASIVFGEYALLNFPNRGPFIEDLSRRAAECLGIQERGIAIVGVFK